MPTFNVTYEIVTPESAEYGDAAERGFLVEGVPLRRALEYLEADGAHVEADCYPVQGPRWLTAYEVRGSMDKGEVESRALHFPESLSDASRMRIARLLGCYGVQ